MAKKIGQRIKKGQTYVCRDSGNGECNEERFICTSSTRGAMMPNKESEGEETTEVE